MEFINVKLSDIGEVVGGATPSTKNPDNYDGNIAWITPKDLAGYNKVYISKGERNITEMGFKSCSTKFLLKNSVLFSSRAPIGYVAISENDLCTNQGFKSIIPNNKIDYKFLYYLLKHNKNYIASKGSGSTFKEVSGSVMKEIELSIPKNINDQKKISKVLFDIDKKIELNNEINNNLLQLCRYKYDELNKKYDEWDLVKINDLNLEVTDYVANGSFKSLADNVTLYDNKEYALYVRNTDLKVNFTDKRKYVDQKSYEFLKKSKLKGGELIISNVGDVGSVFICPQLNMPMTLGSNVIMLYETDSHYYNYFLYFFFTSVYGQYMIGGITGGSAQPKFNKTDFRNMEIKFPAFDELDKFNAEIDPIYKKYELNIKENEKLSELRDTLLPKLMNGEIDLDNI